MVQERVVFGESNKLGSNQVSIFVNLCPKTSYLTFIIFGFLNYEMMEMKWL